MSLPTPTTSRPVIGSILGGIAGAHLALTPVFYRESVDSILKGGVVATLDQDQAERSLRGAGFWYVTTGGSLLVLAFLVGREERAVGIPPAAAVWGLAGLSTWGTVIAPASGFPLLGLAAAYAGWRRRSSPGSQ